MGRVGVLRLGNGRESEVGDRAGAKDEAVRRAAELEIAELLAFCHVVAGRDSFVDHARGDLRYANPYERHQADDRIVGLDENDRPYCHVGQVRL